MFKHTHLNPLGMPVRVPTGRDLATGLGRFVYAAAARIKLWLAVARERRALLKLDERLLRDAGLSRYDAVTEAAKPFWRW